MGYTGHKFNDKGDRLFIRGGEEGFAGAYIKTKRGKEITIDNPEVFEMVVSEKIKNKIINRIEEALSDETDR